MYNHSQSQSIPICLLINQLIKLGDVLKGANLANLHFFSENGLVLARYNLILYLTVPFCQGSLDHVLVVYLNFP